MMSIIHHHHHVLSHSRLRVLKPPVKSLIWLIFLFNQLQVFELTSQSFSNSTLKPYQENAKEETTLNNSSASNNSTTLSSAASNLEPIYFGKYPNTDPHSFPQPPQHPASYQEHQSDFYASDTHPPLGSYYYGVKEDQLRRPNFNLEGSGEPDNDIVTLQAFSTNQDGSSSPSQRGLDTESPDQIRELNLSLLRQLPAKKQVELVRRALLAAQTQRPALNLISGTMLPRQSSNYASPTAYNETSVRNVNMLDSQQHLTDLLSQLRSPDTPQHPKFNNMYGQEEETDEMPQNSGALNLNLNLQQQLQQLMSGNQPTKESPISHPTNNNNNNNNHENDRHFLRRLVNSERAESNDDDEVKSEVNDGKASAAKAIPIERLVDHLMANSRLSTFGIQHENLLLPEDEEVLDEGEDEEEEEEPEGDEAAEEAQESSLVEKKSTLPIGAGFSPMLSNSSSWIPLDGGLEKLSKNVVTIKLNDDKRSKKKTEGDIKTREKSKSKKEKKNKIKKKKKKKKKTSKRKRKRSKRSGLGLVIGDKLLSRNDLIRLISILNKTSKKGKTAKERDVSRKLLRYIIKLMLVDYKKNAQKEESENKILSEAKSQEKPEKIVKEKNSKRVDSIRDLLRPLIEGPSSDNEDKGKKKEIKEKEKEKEDENEDSLIELRPLFSEKFDNKKKTISNDTTDDDESILTTKEEDRDPKESGAKRRHIGLSELSDDLEQYFDTDFYEDMADKMDDKNNKTHIGSASGTRMMRVAAKSGRRPRLVYTVPVPIYGQQLFEAADEDDTDFDAVPIARRTIPGRQRQRRRSAKKRLLRRGKRIRVDDKDDQESDDAEEEEEEPSEPNEDEQEPPMAESEEQSRGEPAVESKNEAASTQEEDQDPQAKITEQDEQQERPKNEPAKIMVKKVKKSTNNAASKPMKKRKRRRRKRRRNNGESEIDYDSRYEIPAPIVPGRMASELRHNNANSTIKTTQSYTQNLAAKKKNSAQNKTPKASVNGNSTLTNKSRKGRASLGKPNKIARSRLKKPQAKQESSHDQPEQSPEEEDEDYYNEGTSYSKICDDDGKCTVSVQSSSPKLGKAIRSKDKTSIAKQLGPWIAKSD